MFKCFLTRLINCALARALVFTSAMLSLTASAGESSSSPVPNSTAPNVPPAPRSPQANQLPSQQQPSPQSAILAESADVKDMTNPTYLLALAQIHIQFGAIDRAEPLLRTAQEKSKDPNQKLAISQALSAILVKKGDTKAAAENIEAAFTAATNPSEKARTGFSLADLYLRVGDADKAESIVLEVAKTDKPRPDEVFIQQNVLRTLTQIFQAKPALLDPFLADQEAQLAKTPTDTTLLERLAHLYGNVKHDPAKNIDYNERIAAAKPNDKTSQYRLAAAYQQGKQYDKAIEIYKKLMTAVGERPDEIRTQAYQVGMLTLQSGKKDDAVAWMAANYAKDIALPRDYGMLASFYEQAGMITEAEETLNKQAEQAQTPDEKIDARMRIADLAFRKKDYAKADEIAKAVEVDFKDNINAQNRAGAMVRRIGFEKNKPIAPVVGTKPAPAPQPGDSKPVAPANSPPDVKPIGVPSDEKTPVPAGGSQTPPAPVKFGADNKPAPAIPKPDAK